MSAPHQRVRPWSLNNPAPGHTPTVGRTQLGMTVIAPARPTYGTTLRCSCGWYPNRGYSKGRVVSNSAPSKGGRSDANRAYQAHIRLEAAK